MSKDPKLEKTSKGKAKEAKSQITGFTATEGLKLNFDPFLIYAYALEDPIIRAAINKKAQKVMAGGWSIEPMQDKPDAESQAEQFEEFTKTAGGSIEETGEQINFDGVLFKMLLSLVTADEIYLEVITTQGGVPGELYVLDWEDMRIKLEQSKEGKSGKIEKYLQIQGDKKVAEFEADEIIHRNMYAQGSRKYGMSLVRSIMKASAGRMFAQGFANSLFVNQKPKGIWFFDMDEPAYKKNVDMIKEGSKKAWNDFLIRGTKDQITYTPIEMSSEMAYKDYIVTNRIEILVGMGVPAGSVFLPGESSGWGADVELAEFDEDINFIRTFIENIINDMIISRFGFDAIKFRFKRSNKRDEEREAKIVQMLSDVLTINERREMLGFQAIEDGDDIIPSMGAGQFKPGEGGADKEELDQSQMQGVGAGRETKKIKGNYKFKNYFRKVFNHNGGLFGKSVSQQPKKIDTKYGPHINRIIKDYANDLNSLLIHYIDDLKEVVIKIGANHLLRKKKHEEIMKVIDPMREIEDMEEIRRTFMIRSKDVGRKYATESYNYGIDVAEVELGMAFSKIAINQETLLFLEKMNVDLVEGAFSEVAQRAKTQIRLGVLEGEGINEIARRLDTMKGSVEQIYKNRSITIARSEVIRASNMGNIESYKNSGVVSKVQVLVGMDPDGKCSAEWGAAPGTLSKPMNPDDFHQVHPSCTCVPIPVVD